MQRIMLTHQAVWRGIDMLAAKNQLSASGLAKRAGLDPTTFNKSKRLTKQGKARWPSTESLSKILDATRTSMTDFVGLIDGVGVGVAATPLARRIRCLRLTQAESAAGVFDAAGFPVGGGWEDIDLAALADDAAYAIEMDRDVAPPLLRTGDVVIVAPHSSVRRDDRIIVKRRGAGLSFGVLTRKTAQRLVVTGFGNGEEEALELRDVAWQARIVAICPNQ